MMSGNAQHSGEGSVVGDDPIFAARLEPHRSMSQRQFAVLMAMIAGACLAGSLAFLAAGAWPILPFLGLDFLIIWLAFFFNFRAGRAFEEVMVWRDRLLVRQVSPAGRIREYAFNPFWTRFFIKRHSEIGIEHMALRSRERELSIGSFLNPADRESFAKALGHALARARGR